MVFNSYTFIVFFAVVLFLHNLPLSWTFKKINLLLASYLFYAVWSPPFLLILIFSTILDFIVGKYLHSETRLSRRRFLLTLSLLGNLGVLGYFKYGGFLMENFGLLMASMGFEYQPMQSDIILPIGISFYTFQTLSYSLDMYKKRYAPEKSVLDFSLFVTFFPQLVAGPIVRPDELLPQFKVPHVASSLQMLQGLLLLTLGLFMKVVLADSLLAEPAEDVFASDAIVHTLDAWTGVLAFSGQIFYDFGGYSTCAIGIALCLGFSIRDNFLYPYGAVGFSDFWRRWHITLSSWLRDYLYIPLGGNRHGVFRTYMALMITMLLGGLWHGAGWTFVVWGGLHGLYLWIEKFFRDKSQKTIPPRFIYALITFFLINITWVFFRASDFTNAWNMLQSMFYSFPDGKVVLGYFSIIKVAIIMSATLYFHWKLREKRILAEFAKLPWWTLGIIWASMLILLIWSQESTSSFIYFQF
ncbi:MAG: MBOAT family protein [Saprospiraceae bacterium]|nr:MBOAT family protein [Saprospiraceae bacterium]